MYTWISYECWYSVVMLPTWITIILTILAVYRVTRFITRDAFPLIAIPREKFAQRWAVFTDATTREELHTSLNGSHTNIVMRSLAYLWECDWCMSIWVATGITYGTYTWLDVWWWQSILLALSASSITGLIAQHEPE